MVFEVFRRRQKQLMATLVVLTMFLFIASDQINKWIYPQGGQDYLRNVDAGRMWGKRLTAADVEEFSRDRRRLRDVLVRIVEKSGKPEGSLELGSLFGYQQDFSERVTLTAMALDGKADRMGIRVTDADVNAFVRKCAGGGLSAADFKAALHPPAPKRKDERRSNSNEPMDEDKFFRLLARELKIRRAAEAMTSTPRFTAVRTTPLEAYREAELSQTKFNLELVRLPIEKYIDAKAEPATEALQRIYDTYKGRDPNPENGVIGFRLPPRASAEYLVAKVDNFLDKVTVSDKEISQFYEENRNSRFVKEPEAPKPTVSSPASPPKPGDVVKPPPAPPKDMKSSPPPAPPKDVKTTPPAKAPTAAKATEEKKAAPPVQTPKASPPPAPPKDAKPAGEKKSEPAKKTSSLMPGAARVVALTTLVSTFVQDKQPAKQPPATPPKDAKPAEKPAPKQEAAKAPPKASLPVAPKKDEKPAPQTKAGDKPLNPADLGKAKTEDLMKVQYKPLAEVRKEIETELKRQKVRVMLKKQLEDVQKELASYSDLYVAAKRKFQDSQGKAGAEQTFTPPAPPRTFEQIAKQMGFERKTTGLVTPEEAKKIPDIGNSFFEDNNSFRIFSTYLVDPSQELYAPKVIFSDAASEEFLYWKTEHQAAKEPDFTAVRDKVVAVWRKEQAKIPAKKAADEIADKWKKAPTKPEEALKGTGLELNRPASFSLSMQGAFNNATGRFDVIPRTEVPDVKDAGAHVLDAIYEMEEGDVKVVAPPSIDGSYFVIRLAKREAAPVGSFANTFRTAVRGQVFDATKQPLGLLLMVNEQEALADAGWQMPTSMRDSKKGDDQTPELPESSQ